MRWSIKSLMLYMTAFAVCLAFTQAEAKLAGAALLVALCSLNFVLPLRMWRFLTYGALIGVVTAFVAVAIYARSKLGIVSARTYQGMSMIDDIQEPLRPYLFPMGAFIGGSVGLLLYQRSNKPTEIQAV